MVIVIPARYASTRFPGKPLALLGGKEIILHVCERASQACDNVVVATDDERILKAVNSAGHRAVMTSTDHKSGTDRVAEAIKDMGDEADVVINIQSDEPFIDPSQIKLLASAFDDPEVEIATLARKFDPALGFEALFDANLVKVVFGNDGRALYFSRSIVPYVRGEEWQKWLETNEFHTHIGIYAYRREALNAITRLPESSLERAERLEQLRWLQNGFNIRVLVTEAQNIGIDTPADLAKAEEILSKGIAKF